MKQFNSVLKCEISIPLALCILPTMVSIFIAERLSYGQKNKVPFARVPLMEFAENLQRDILTE